MDVDEPIFETEDILRLMTTISHEVARAALEVLEGKGPDACRAFLAGVLVSDHVTGNVPDDLAPRIIHYLATRKQSG